MGQKRLFIGAFIGVIVFSIISVLGGNFWFGINQIVLNLESKISFNKKFSNKDSIILDYSKEFKENFFENTDSQERKELFYKLTNKLSKLTPLSINIVLSKENKISIFQNDIDKLQDEISTPIQSIQNKDIELSWLNENNKQVLLDHSINPIFVMDLGEYDNGLIDEYKLSSKNIFLISPNLNLTKDDFNKLINYFEGRSVKFISFSKPLLFLAIISFAIFTSLMVYPARIAVFAIISLVAFITAQINYSFFNNFLEISPLIIGLLMSLLATNIFDLDFQELFKINFFKQEIAEEFKNFQKKDYSKKNELKKEPSFETAINRDNPEPKAITEDMLEEIRFDLRNKHYVELETKLEEIAIEFEEQCFDKIDLIQNKLIELLSENEMSERDNLRLGLIKHNFDQLLTQIDRNHFDMTPFRTEAQQGFINVLEHLATKIYYQTKSKVQIQLESSITKLELRLQDKINIFRILENIFSLIVAININHLRTALEIKTKISHQNNSLLFSIYYQGEDLSKYKSSNELQESMKRIASIKGARLNIENNQGLNQIHLGIKNIFVNQDSFVSY
jgi:hypothetical protein